MPSPGLVSIRQRGGRKRQPGTPFGPGPAAALEEALKLAGELGTYVPTTTRAMWAPPTSTTRTTALHILGHLDVVAPGEGWTVTQPYSP